MAKLVESILVEKKTASKVLQNGFYWPILFRHAHDYCKRCSHCQQLEKTGRKDMMPLTPIIVVDIFDV